MKQELLGRAMTVVEREEFLRLKRQYQGLAEKTTQLLEENSRLRTAVEEAELKEYQNQS